MYELTTEGIDEIQSLLDDMSYFELEEFKDDFQQIIVNDEYMRFALSPSTTSGGFAYPETAGIYWEKLKDSTLKQKPNRQFGNLLIDSETLKNSVTIPNGNGQFVEVLGKSISFKTDVEYAGFVQDKRQFLFWHDELINKMRMSVLDYLAKSRRGKR